MYRSLVAFKFRVRWQVCEGPSTRRDCLRLNFNRSNAINSIDHWREIYALHLWQQHLMDKKMVMKTVHNKMSLLIRWGVCRHGKASPVMSLYSGKNNVKYGGGYGAAGDRDIASEKNQLSKNKCIKHIVNIAEPRHGMVFKVYHVY